MEQKNQPAKRWLVPTLLLLVILLLVVVLVFILNRKDTETQVIDDGSPILAYAEGTTIVEDPEALQKAVNEMYAEARKGGMALEYKNDATSTDGEKFSCYIANSLSNSYDMYVQIFADAELTDQLLLTGLIRPGEAFDNITLEHALDPGTHTVYVAFTQVEEDLATIHAQVFVTMEFTVTE